jgi:hypothetical protein
MKNIKILNFLIEQQKWFMLILLIIILGIPLLNNFTQDQPLIMGGESYYLLNEFNIPTYYAQYLFWIPLTLGIISLFLFINLTKKIKIKKEITFWFLSFLILTPTFIYTYSTISAYAFLTFFVLLSLTLLENKNKFLNYLALIPIIAVTFIDVLSTVILVIILLYFFGKNKFGRNFKIFLLTTLTVALISNIIFFARKLILGPFHTQTALSTLISDLGSLSGVSFFILLFSIFGLTILWGKKKSAFIYLFFAFILAIYILNVQAIYLLTLIIIYFATFAFIKTKDRIWELESVKKFTIFLLVLGVIFSTITYLDRVNATGPTASDQEALIWIEENIVIGKVFSAQEDSYYIKYLADKESVEPPHSKNGLTKSMLDSLYIAELFPLFEENNVSIVYITEKMRNNLDQETGLLFLLKNERFKLVHSAEQTEVWVFE